MIITLLDPHEKNKLWQVKESDNTFYLREVVPGKQSSWKQQDIKTIVAPFSCGSWYSLQKQKLNTDKFRGWKGFGYRKSAYSTWLVDGYFNKQPQALALKTELLNCTQFIKHQACLPNTDSLHYLSNEVKTIGKIIFNGLNSFSHYGDFETVNWQEIALNWAK